jgi:hypothetical protein
VPDARLIGRALGRTALTGALRAGEIVRRPVARTASDVPAGADAVTAEWLTAVLCGDRPGTSVSRIDRTGGSTATTSRVALRVEYSGEAAGLPRDVFVKLTESFQQRLFLGLIRILEGEPFFYASIRPLVDFECPHGFHGGHDPRSWRSAVVIEDIAATRGATFCHATTPVDRQGVESLVQGMAAYHGALWNHPVVTSSTLKRPVDHVRNTSDFLNMLARSKVGVERAGDRYPDALRSRHDELWAGLQASMRMCSDPAGPTTFLHGDPHVGNTYRLPDGRMGFTDWQVAMRGHWAYDFGDFLASALTVEDRRAWERDLLALYLEELARAGAPAPGFDDAWRAYRQCLMYPFFCWTTVLGASSWMPETQPEEASKIIIERVATAIDDLDALGAF